MVTPVYGKFHSVCTLADVPDCCEFVPEIWLRHRGLFQPQKIKYLSSPLQKMLFFRHFTWNRIYTVWFLVGFFFRALLGSVTHIWSQNLGIILEAIKSRNLIIQPLICATTKHREHSGVLSQIDLCIVFLSNTVSSFEAYTLRLESAVCVEYQISS